MKVAKAIYYSAESHMGQCRRDSGLPYIVHTYLVMHLLTKFKGDSKHVEDLQCAALLHDTLEDTEVEYVELEREFGPMVASLVMELTNDDVAIAAIGKNEYLKRKMLEMSKYAFLLKLIDRLANIMDSPKDKYVVKTIELIEYLTENRSDLTQRQGRVMTAITNECERILEANG